MKIQWFGCGHHSKQATLHYDYFGLSNFHRLKFRNTLSHQVSKGESKTMPMIAVMSSGCPEAPEPAFAARLIVRSIINDFRHQGRSELLDSEMLSKWIRFEIDDVRSKMMNLVGENRQLTGFSGSVTVLILCGKRATIAQLGDTTLYHQRKKNTVDLSNGDWGELLSDESIYPVINQPEGDLKVFRQQRLTSRRTKSIELKPLIFTIDVKKNDLFFLCTKGVASVAPPEKLHEFTRKTRCIDDIEQSTYKILTRSSELNATDSISGLMLRIR